MEKKYLFKSERLGFRNWIEGDKIPFYKMNSDQEVMKYFPKTLSKEESDHLVERLSNHFIEFNFTFFAVDELKTGKFIGFIGMVHSKFDAHFTPCVEIGWRLQQESWNNGFATEGALKCLQYAWKNFNFENIYSITALKNSPSENVMQKIGMERQGTFEHSLIKEGHWLKTELYYKISNPNVL